MDDVRENTAKLERRVSRFRRVALLLLLLDILIAATWLVHARWVRVVTE